MLVGGEGTRLRPLTLTVPKQMLPVVGVPMIERVLGALAVHGIDEAVLSLGYLPDAFVRAYPDGEVAGVHLVYAVEPEPLDTAGAVRFAARAGGVDDTFVVVNGDVVTDLDVSALVAFHRKHGAEGTIALHPVPDPSAFGVVPTDEHGRVTAFVEKPRREEAPTDLVNAGTYVLEPSVLARIPTGRAVSIERETFPAMVADGSLFAMDDGGAYWLDLGTPAAYVQACRDLLEGRRGEPPSPGARRGPGGAWTVGSPLVDGAVDQSCWVGDGARVAAGAAVRRGVLGPGSVVEAGAAVIESVVLDGARVEAGAEVDGSIIGPRATVGAGAVVRGLSVVGAEAVVAPGTVLDGRRVPA
ncbi:MAG TPA: NDP-sugar synthase [Acidimicrobiales bacterium]|nr:NDP-sugar synthase [Acidimicrobiales bacterium]